MLTKKLLYLVSLATAFSAFSGNYSTIVSASSDTSINCDHDFDYKYDYTKYQSYSNDWKQDVYESNFMTISPQQSALGVGEQNVSCDGTGYVVYKYDAPVDKAFNQLTVHWIGRVFHNIESGKCAEGTCECGLDVLVSGDNVTYTNVGYEAPSLLGASRGFKHDLTPYIHGTTTAYLKLVLHGLSWDWVELEKVNIYGTYCSNSTNIASVNVHNSTNDRMHKGDNISIDVAIKNNSDTAFAGTLKVYAPTYYFDNLSPLSVSLAANETKIFTIPATLLEGGYTNFFVLLNDGVDQLDQFKVTSFGRGEGTYLFDGHSHSFVSDGRNDFYDNYTQAHERGFSGAISTDHDAPLPNDATDIKNAARVIDDSIDEDFIALKGSEETTSGNFHILCYNYGTEYPSLMNSQEVINGVVNQGGYAYLAHPFLPGYNNPNLGTDPKNVDALENMTGIELYNGESTEARGQDCDFVDDTFEYFDRLNITGKKKYYGVVGSDAHDAILMGNVANAFTLDDLTEENVIKTLGTGKSYVTTGAELRFTIDGKTYGESVRIRGNETVPIHIEAFDPNSPITKVVLYKYSISSDNDLAYEQGQNNASVLYERDGNNIYHFIYDENIEVEEDTFYRVEVITENGSLEWSKPEYYGFAKGNPIWIEKEITSFSVTGNPTKTEVEQYSTIDISGFELTAHYYDGTTKVIKNYRVTDIDTSKLGQMNVRFVYEDYTYFVTYTVVEEQGVIHVANGKIDYYIDFTKYPAYSTDWAKGSGADSTSGYLTISPNATGLGVGKKNVQSYGSGYVDYRIEVPDGNIVDSLELDVKGRIYHSTSNSMCSAGTCGCCFKVLTSVDGGCNFDLAYDYDVDSGHSTWNQDYNIDVSDTIGNSKCVIVRIMMSCRYWDWICVQSLRMNGTYIPGESIEVAEKGSVLIGGGTIKYEKNYTSYPQYDSSWKDEKAVYETGGNLTISPSTRCLGVGKQNVSSTGSGYVSYLVDVKDGNIIDNLTFSATGRIYHSSSNAECAAETCNCAFKIYICTDGGYIYKEVYNHVMNHSDSKFNTTVSVDLTDYIKDKQSVIIKMYMSGKSWDWVGITDVNINGTYKQGACVRDVVVADTIDQEYYLMGSHSDEWKQYAYSYSNICVGEGDKPWLGIEPGAGGFTGKRGEVVYKLTSSTGSFADLSITGVARVFTYENSVAYFGISISFNNEEYTNIVEYTPTTNGNYLENIDLSLTDYVDGKAEIYIKIEMESGLWDWVCLKELHILGYSVSNYVSLTVIDNFGNTLFSTDEFVKSTGLDLSNYGKDGYDIEGLYTDSDFKNKLDGNIITGEYTTIYVNYVLHQYEIRFHNADIDNASYNIETGFTLPVPTASEGKSFAGWYLSEDFAGNPVTEIPVGSIGDIDLYAKFVDSDELIAYRQQKIEELNNLVNFDDYRNNEKAQISEILTAAINQINTLTSQSAIDEVVNNAKAEIQAIKTDAQYRLIECKQSATNELDNYVDYSLYRENEQAQIRALIASAKEQIANATSIEEVNRIVSNVKTEIQAIKTDIVLSLEEAKANVITSIDEYIDSLDQSNYSKDNYNQIISLANEAKNQINSATSVEDVNNIWNSYKAQIDAVKTKKSGCGGNIEIMASSSLILATLGIVVCALKKKEEN